MVPRFSLVIFFILLVAASNAQKSIKGRVVDAVSGKSISGSSIFISNTTIGTSSDSQGNFEISNIAPGQYDLIISSIGYETSVYHFSDAELPLRLRIEMEIKVRELENVIVEPSVEENWARWGKTFEDNFLGVSSMADKCVIKNKDAIHFRYFRKSNRLIAYCDEPVIVENKLLGYVLKYQLENFEIIFQENRTTFAGYPFFEDFEAKERRQRKYQAARDKAYYGSIMHFVRSLYKDSLAYEGFEVRRMKRVPNYEKERVKAIYPRLRFAKIRGVDRMINKTTQYTLSIDTSSYYDKVIQQDNYHEIYGVGTLSLDSIPHLKSSDQGMEISFPDFLLVTYKKELEEKEYLAYQRESNRKPTYQRSYIWLVETPSIFIYPNGSYYSPQQLFSSAYWGWSEKNSLLLPLDYQPSY